MQTRQKDGAEHSDKYRRLGRIAARKELKRSGDKSSKELARMYKKFKKDYGEKTPEEDMGKKKGDSDSSSDSGRQQQRQQQ